MARGFLLVEVLVALVIIAIAVTASLTGLGRALKVTGRTEAFTRTVLPMESVLFDLETGYRTDLIEEGGDVVAQGEPFHVDREILLPETPEAENAELVVTPPPYYKLDIVSSGPDEPNVFRTEMFLGQEMFKS